MQLKKKKGDLSLYCGLICLYFKLPNPSDHLEELFLVSLIMDSIGVTGGARQRPPALPGPALPPRYLQPFFPSVTEDSGKAHLQSKDEIFPERTLRVWNTRWGSHCFSCAQALLPQPGLLGVGLVPDFLNSAPLSVVAHLDSFNRAKRIGFRAGKSGLHLRAL